MIGRLRLLRNPKLTIANLLYELVPVSGSALVSRELDSTGSLVGELDMPATYSEVASMSRFLVEETGLRRGDRVGIWRLATGSGSYA